MRCYRRLLNISYKDHVMKEEVRNEIQSAIRVHDDLITMVKKQKLRWYGHISRSFGMAKTILQGTVKGARRREDRRRDGKLNIKEWTGLKFGDSLRAAEDREGWKGIVATSSVVPQWPPRLRDRDEMRQSSEQYRRWPDCTICIFVVCIWHKQVFSSHGSYQVHFFYTHVQLKHNRILVFLYTTLMGVSSKKF